VLAVASLARAAVAHDCHEDIHPVYLQTDVPSLINAVDEAQIERIRAQLIAYIWKAPGLPQALPVVVEDVANPFTAVTAVPPGTRVDELSVTLEDFVSRMYLYTPRHARRRLTIVHQGHSWLARDGTGQAVEYLLRQRHHVLVVHMPMYGPNSAPFGPVPYFHDPMFNRRESPTLSPFKYFVEPVVQAVNYATQVMGIWRVAMIGLSGGGWTTTLAAAIDPRIKLSVSVAGSLPTFLFDPADPCIGPKDRGDIEQYHPVLYRIANHLDLYILGAHGNGRGQLQVLNQYDSCCFEGVRYRTYRPAVRDAVSRLRLGRFEVFLDSSHRQHKISAHALETAIVPFLRRRRF
jgi:hypothetical protein